MVVETGNGSEKVTVTGAHGGDIIEMRGVRQATQEHTASGEEIVTLKGEENHDRGPEFFF